MSGISQLSSVIEVQFILIKLHTLQSFVVITICAVVGILGLLSAAFRRFRYLNLFD